MLPAQKASSFTKRSKKQKKTKQKLSCLNEVQAAFATTAVLSCMKKGMGAYKLSSELPSDFKVHGLVPATTPTEHTDTLEARITNTSSSCSSSSRTALQLLHVELCSSSFHNLKLDRVKSPKSPCNISSVCLSVCLSLSHTHTHTHTHTTGSSII